VKRARSATDPSKSPATPKTREGVLPMPADRTGPVSVGPAKGIALSCGPQPPRNRVNAETAMWARLFFFFFLSLSSPEQRCGRSRRAPAEFVRVASTIPRPCSPGMRAADKKKTENPPVIKTKKKIKKENSKKPGGRCAFGCEGRTVDSGPRARNEPKDRRERSTVPLLPGMTKLFPAPPQASCGATLSDLHEPTSRRRTPCLPLFRARPRRPMLTKPSPHVKIPVSVSRPARRPDSSAAPFPVNIEPRHPKRRLELPASMTSLCGHLDGCSHAGAGPAAREAEPANPTTSPKHAPVASPASGPP